MVSDSLGDDLVAKILAANEDSSKPEEDATAVATSITERLSQELVIALVGPVGSGVSTAGVYIRELLQQKFGYDVPSVFGLSDVIRNEMFRVNLEAPPKEPLDNYIDKMQSAGNALRKKFGKNYLVEKTIEKIVRYRKDNGGYSRTNSAVPLPGRRAYIIDSLKNISELELLRHIYGESLCLFGIFA